jgi:hypothetical protein
MSVDELKSLILARGGEVLPDTRLPVFHVDGELVTVEYWSPKHLKLLLPSIERFAFHKMSVNNHLIGGYFKFKNKNKGIT